MHPGGMAGARSRECYQTNRTTAPLDFGPFPSLPGRSSPLPGLARNALVDMLLVDGDLLANIKLIEDPTNALAHQVASSDHTFR